MKFILLTLTIILSLGFSFGASAENLHEILHYNGLQYVSAGKTIQSDLVVLSNGLVIRKEMGVKETSWKYFPEKQLATPDLEKLKKSADNIYSSSVYVPVKVLIRPALQFYVSAEAYDSRGGVIYLYSLGNDYQGTNYLRACTGGADADELRNFINQNVYTQIPLAIYPCREF